MEDTVSANSKRGKNILNRGVSLKVLISLRGACCLSFWIFPLFNIEVYPFHLNHNSLIEAKSLYISGFIGSLMYSQQVCHQ